MINNSSLQVWSRLRQKQLGQQFVNEIITGLNCSPFEAAAVLQTVERVYGNFFDSNGTLKPGQMQCLVVSESAPPQLPLARCEMVNVVLTLDDGEGDLKIRQHEGITGLRRERLQRLCREAYQQGGLLTLEDLAYRLLNSSPRTLSRDVADLRKQGIILELRSTKKDMGRSVTHRALLVKQWLLGKSYTEIERSHSHSIKSVANYVEKFKRVVALHLQKYRVEDIGFLVKLSVGLVGEYISLYASLPIVESRQEELEEFIKKTALQPPTIPGKPHQPKLKQTTLKQTTLKQTTLKQAPVKQGTSKQQTSEEVKLSWRGR